MKYKFIAIEGNIGAGKTTLASRLASGYNTRLLLEEFEHNPFLPKFYKDPSRYALSLELSFLAERFHQVEREMKTQDQPRVSDYYFNKSLIFARANLSGAELDVFERFFSILEVQLPKPELLIFLNPLTDKLQNNIQKRGREYERDIQVDYLYRIHRSYIDYLESQKDLPVIMLELKSSAYINSLDDFAFLDRLLNADYKKGITRVTL